MKGANPYQVLKPEEAFSTGSDVTAPRYFKWVKKTQEREKKGNQEPSL
jgi:ribosomal protein L24E